MHLCLRRWAAAVLHGAAYPLVWGKRARGARKRSGGRDAEAIPAAPAPAPANSKRAVFFKSRPDGGTIRRRKSSRRRHAVAPEGSGAAKSSTCISAASDAPARSAGARPTRPEGTGKWGAIREFVNSRRSPPASWRARAKRSLRSPRQNRLCRSPRDSAGPAAFRLGGGAQTGFRGGHHVGKETAQEDSGVCARQRRCRIRYTRKVFLKVSAERQ